MTKKQNRQITKRQVRRREKMQDVPRDKTMGGVCRRGYGSGITAKFIGE